MAKYTFRIHKIESTSENSGWLKSEGITGENIALIPDTTEGNKITGKIGTSIPTPLARIYLFDTAFKMMNEAYVKGDNETLSRGSYAELVSDCLDILQMLYEKGTDENSCNPFEFVSWNVAGQIQQLKNSKSDTKKLLGESLDMAFGTAKVFGGEITLIKYNDILLGGLSPFSLVYSNPNLRRILNEKRGNGDFDLSSNQKVDFFGVNPVHLCDRPDEFQEYLYSMVKTYNEAMADANSPLRNFSRYVINQVGEKFENEKEADVKESFEKNCAEFNPQVVINEIHLKWNCRTPNLENSDFLMVPTAEEYKKYMPVPPLVLPERWTQYGWKYIDQNDDWDTSTQVLARQCRDLNDGSYKGNQIAARRLPKNGSHNGELSNIKYPWMSNSDFFYDDVVALGYAIDTEKYFNNATTNAEGGVVTFLLPIRREYFLFFTLDDLKQNLKISARYENPKRLNSLQEVKVELTIKLRNNKIITLNKMYGPENIKEVQMGMGIFPFYQLHKESKLKNQYSVYMFDVKKNMDLKFYSDTDLANAIDVKGFTRTSIDAGASKIFNLRLKKEGANKFDFIEAVMAGDDNASYSALIVPKWIKFDKDHNDKQAKKTMIALDFGTSNTHIAYYNPDNGVQPFSVPSNEMQMVLLNKPCEVDAGKDYRNKTSFGRIGAMTDLLREFVPSVIGKENIQGIEYPVKTASLNSPKLYDKDLAVPFETVNIGYDINNETVEVDANFEYATDLKWAAQEARAAGEGGVGGVESKRIDAYCEQTLWMLKNMIVNKGYYAGDIKMVYFYPASMEDLDKNMFADAWSKAKDTVFDSCGFKVDLQEPELESVAPYYSLLNKVDDTGLFAYNSVNIDIGGGTTDVFILDKESRDPDTGNAITCGYEASVQFAGDNIWGTTKPIGNVRNGFVAYMDGLITSNKINLSEELKKKYDAVKKRAGKSNGKKGENGDKDIAAFFFKYPEAFQFANRISNNPHLKKVLLIHYASIIYYVTDIIKHIKKDKPEFVMPQTLTFTGKGSEYIKIISSDPKRIQKLTFLLFNAFGIPNSEFKHGFKVAYPENPKVLTAEGGIHKYMNPAIGIEFVEKESTYIPNQDDGMNRENAFFEQVGESILGFNTEEDVTYKANKVMLYKDSVMDHFNRFIDAIFNARTLITKELSDINFETADLEFIKKKASESFDTLAKRYEDAHTAEDAILKSNIFFFAIANMIVEYSNVQKK